MIQCFRCGAELSNENIKAEFGAGETINVRVTCPQCKVRSGSFLACAELFDASLFGEDDEA